VRAQPPDDLDLFLALSLASQHAWTLIKREFAAAGVDTGWWGLLAHIDAAGSSTPSQLAAETGVTQTTIRDQVQSLVDRGLVRRKSNPDDGRSYFVELTARGRDQLARGLAASDRARALIEEELGQSLESFRKICLELARAASAVASAPDRARA
jgi:DNA-binding MarR family transcriptional regulator